jgi:site-specific DNA-cytosine methylase
MRQNCQRYEVVRVLDLFAGTGSATKAFEDAGHEVIKVELDEYFEAHERDILTLTADYLKTKYGQFDFVWASPPCQKFSVASIWCYWELGEDKVSRPKKPEVWEAIDLIKHTLQLIQNLKPIKGWVLENPRGMLRKQEFMLAYPRHTITYCQYGDTRMKPTDVWGEVPNWTPRAMCSPRKSCHESSPAGTNAGGTGKLKNAKLRSMIPYELGLELLTTIEGK